MNTKYTQPHMWKLPPKESWVKDAISAKNKHDKEQQQSCSSGVQSGRISDRGLEAQQLSSFVPLIENGHKQSAEVQEPVEQDATNGLQSVAAHPIKPTLPAFAQRQTDLGVTTLEFEHPFEMCVCSDATFEAQQLELDKEKELEPNVKQKAPLALPEEKLAGSIRGNDSTGDEPYSIDWTVSSGLCPFELPSSLKRLSSIVPPIKNGQFSDSQPNTRRTPVPVPASAWSAGKPNSELESFEPPQSDQVSMQNFGPQPFVPKKAPKNEASKTWSLEIQESLKQEVRKKQLELPVDSVSTASANVQASMIKLAEQQIRRLEDSNRELKKERDDAVKLAQANGNRLEQIRRNLGRPLAKMLVMARLLKVMGLSDQHQKVAEGILTSASAMNIEVFGTQEGAAGPGETLKRDGLVRSAA